MEMDVAKIHKTPVVTKAKTDVAKWFIGSSINYRGSRFWGGGVGVGGSKNMDWFQQNQSMVVAKI